MTLYQSKLLDLTPAMLILYHKKPKHNMHAPVSVRITVHDFIQWEVKRIKAFASKTPFLWGDEIVEWSRLIRR